MRKYILKIYPGLLCAAAVIFLSACTTTSTKMSETWKAPDFQGRQYNNLLVLAVGKTDTNRHIFEDALAKALIAKGAQAKPSYTVLSNTSEISKAAVEEAIKKYHYDGIIVTTLIGVDSYTKRVSTPSYVVSTGYPVGYRGYRGYQGYYGYYRNSYIFVNGEDYDIEKSIVSLETKLYDIQSEKLVWSGRSTTFEPESATAVISSVTDIISKELIKEGVIR